MQSLAASKESLLLRGSKYPSVTEPNYVAPGGDASSDEMNFRSRTNDQLEITSGFMVETH